MAGAKFIFEREFPATPDRIVPLEKKEATLTLSEHQRLLAAAVAAARTEAFTRGRQEADADQTARLAEAMEHVGQRLGQVSEDIEAARRKAAAEAVRFSHAFALKLAGRLLDQAPLAAIENAARAIFDDLRGQAHVAVRVAADLTDAARDRLTAVARERGFEGRLIVLGEPETPPGDVRIEWADGGIVRDRAMLETTIAQGVERALAAS